MPPHMRRHWNKLLLVLLIGATIVPALVWSVEDVPAGQVDAEFYSAAAQIIPVLLLAVFLEIANLFGPLREINDTISELEKDLREQRERQRQEMTRLGSDEILKRLEVARTQADTDDLERRVAALRRSVGTSSIGVQLAVLFYVLQAAAGEVAALYVVTGQESTAFLLYLTANGLWALLVVLVGVFVRRFSL
jgi:hypothetical protein